MKRIKDANAITLITCEVCGNFLTSTEAVHGDTCTHCMLKINPKTARAMQGNKEEEKDGYIFFKTKTVDLSEVFANVSATPKLRLEEVNFDYEFEDEENEKDIYKVTYYIGAHERVFIYKMVENRIFKLCIYAPIGTPNVTVTKLGRKIFFQLQKQKLIQ